MGDEKVHELDIEKICIHMHAAFTQREAEISRGTGTKGTFTQDQTGCYYCPRSPEHMYQCPAYFPFSLMKRPGPKEATRQGILKFLNDVKEGTYNALLQEPPQDNPE